MGGTGKTPATTALAALLRDTGLRVAILSRGYGRDSRGARIVSLGEGPRVEPREAGDEPYGYARALPGVAVAVAARREAAAQLLALQFDADVFLLDDAFQHVRVGRELDLVVVDGDAPFWEGDTPPAGRLREGVAAAGRADGFLVTGAQTEACRRQLARRFPGRPVYGLAVQTPGAQAMSAWQSGDGDVHALRGPVLAFAGIARPERFFASIRSAGLAIAEQRVFGDHHWYSSKDLQELERRAAAHAAELVTTEKDAARLVGQSGLPRDLHVWRYLLTAHAPDELRGWICNRIGLGRAP